MLYCCNFLCHWLLKYWGIWWFLLGGDLPKTQRDLIFACFAKVTTSNHWNSHRLGFTTNSLPNVSLWNWYNKRYGAHWTQPLASVRGVGVAIDRAVVVYVLAEVGGPKGDGLAVSSAAAIYLPGYKCCTPRTLIPGLLYGHGPKAHYLIICTNRILKSKCSI